MGAFLLYVCLILCNIKLTVRFKAIKIQTENTIFAAIKIGVVSCPENSKTESAAKAEKIASRNGTKKDKRLLKLNLTRILRRIKERRKLYPSITTITTA